MSILTYSTELEESIILWFNTILTENNITSFQDIADGIPIILILHQIDPKSFELKDYNFSAKDDWALGASNLNKITKIMYKYCTNVLTVSFDFDKLDIQSIARDKDINEIMKLIEALLAIIVQCEVSQKFLTPLLGLRQSSQEPIWNCLNLIMDKYKKEDSFQYDTDSINNLEKTLSATLEEKQKLMRKINDMEKEVESAGERSRRYQLRIQELERMNAELEKEMKSRKNSHVSEELGVDAHLIKDLEFDVERKDHRIQELQMEREELERIHREEIGALKDDRDILQDQVEEAHQNKLRLAKAQENVAALEVFKKSYEESRKEVEAFQAKALSFESEAKEAQGLSSTYQKMRDELQLTKDENAKLQVELSKRISQTDTLSKEYKKADELHKYYQNKTKETQTELDRIRKENFSLPDAAKKDLYNEEVETQIQSLRNENRILKAQGTGGLKADMLNKQKELDDSVREQKRLKETNTIYESKIKELHLENENYQRKLDSLDDPTGVESISEFKRIKMERDNALDKLTMLSKQMVIFGELKNNLESVTLEKNTLMKDLQVAYKEKSDLETKFLNAQEENLHLHKDISQKASNLNSRLNDIEKLEGQLKAAKESEELAKKEVAIIKEESAQTISSETRDKMKDLERERDDVKIKLELQDGKLKIKELEEQIRLKEDQLLKQRQELIMTQEKKLNEMKNKYEEEKSKLRSDAEKSTEQSTWIKKQHEEKKDSYEREQRLMASAFHTLGLHIFNMSRPQVNTIGKPYLITERDQRAQQPPKGGKPPTRKGGNH